MSRRIITTQFQSTGGGDVDGFFDRLIKYIPSDVVAGWIVAKNLISSYQSAPPQTLWICFVAGLALTVVVVRYTPKGPPPTWFQVGISVVAFAIWTWALGDPLASTIPHSSLFSSLTLIGYTILVAALIPPKS
jgi:hypothetical protein